MTPPSPIRVARRRPAAPVDFWAPARRPSPPARVLRAALRLVDMWTATPERRAGWWTVTVAHLTGTVLLVLLTLARLG